MHRGAAAPTEKAAVECILSSRLLLLGLTSHGIEPDVKCENIKCWISQVVPDLPGRRRDQEALVKVATARRTRGRFHQAEFSTWEPPSSSGGSNTVNVVDLAAGTAAAARRPVLVKGCFILEGKH
jgi:hypothetical protein